MVDVVMFAILYTTLLMFVSTVYYVKGRREGMETVVSVIAKLEPDFFSKFKPRLERIVNGNETNT